MGKFSGKLLGQNQVQPSGVPDISRTAKAMIKLQQGTYSDEGEILDYSYYDTQRIAAATLEHNYFLTSQGEAFDDGVAGFKDFSDVNFPGRGMPSTQNFEIKAIKIIYKPAEVRTEAEMVNIVDMLRKSKFSFLIGNKAPVLELNMLDLMGINFPVVKAAAAVADDHIRAIAAKAYPLNISLVLAGQTKFNCLIQHAAAPAAGIAGDLIQISLQGILQRLS
jgi:hypothetical protein